MRSAIILRGMATTSFDTVTSWTPAPSPTEGVARFTLAGLPAEWMQGRGAFGGVVGAVGLRTMRTLVPAERTPRSVSVTFYGPVSAEPATLDARVVRAGRNVTFAEAEIVQGGTPRARISATFGADRESSVAHTAPTVELPDPDGFVRFAHIPNVTPQFVGMVDWRWTEGGFPFTGTEGSTLASFLRFEIPAARGYERLVGLLDIMPAPVLQNLDRPAPASSIQWTSHFVAPDTVPHGDYAWFRYETVAAGDGYSTTIGRLYDLEGRLLAWQEQLHAVFG